MVYFTVLVDYFALLRLWVYSDCDSSSWAANVPVLFCRFMNLKMRSMVFEDSLFEECYFEDITSSNTFFKNCTFIATLFYNTGELAAGAAATCSFVTARPPFIFFIYPPASRQRAATSAVLSVCNNGSIYYFFHSIKNIWYLLATPISIVWSSFKTRPLIFLFALHPSRRGRSRRQQWQLHCFVAHPHCATAVGGWGGGCFCNWDVATTAKQLLTGDEAPSARLVSSF